jgi:hypothetical protein
VVGVLLIIVGAGAWQYTQPDFMPCLHSSLTG